MLHPHPAAKSLATEIGLLALRTFLKRVAEGTPMPWQGYYPSLVQSHVRDSLHWLRHLVAGIRRIDAKKNFLAEKLAFLETEPEEWEMAERPSFVWDKRDETRLNH
ncbi:unnamed protein product [Symbiodinium sp. CCMP2456]|nr:unnamed protein product [Symbiodinium sp. CCMP2456]